MRLNMKIKLKFLIQNSKNLIKSIQNKLTRKKENTYLRILKKKHKISKFLKIKKIF